MKTGQAAEKGLGNAGGGVARLCMSPHTSGLSTPRVPLLQLSKLGCERKSSVCPVFTKWSGMQLGEETLSGRKGLGWLLLLMG